MAERVFVVDDEKVIADTLTAILNASGYQASGFYDAESALIVFETESPDCLISDVLLPGMSGIDLAVQVRQLFPACRVLLFSGQAATRRVLDAARREGHEFELLLKPIHPIDLLTKLQMGSRSQAPSVPAASVHKAS
jgi:DNA-binding NtrC family response regulator